ncbi:MAG TPA: hypothetical protein VGL72_08950 [Bryobacteraceae bacterium]|jgi:hypothetical protein
MFVHKTAGGMVRLLICGAFAITSSLPAEDHDAHAHDAHQQTAPAKLVQMVRDATRQFTDVNAATAANYWPFLGCVSGPDHGAMGVHYVNGDLVADGQIDAARPEALIYEAQDGWMRLVGVEFIVDAATWNANHSSPPVLEGQTFQFVDSPNRFGLAPFYELHVWAWKDNPDGAFVDWNRRVSCEGQ